MPELNATELHAVQDLIHEHPELHDQKEYGVVTDCGTAFCVAGHALVRVGYRTALSIRSYAEIVRFDGTTRADVDGSWAFVEFYRPDDEQMEPGYGMSYSELFDAGRDVLGLDEYQASSLFDSDNELAEIDYYIRCFTGRDYMAEEMVSDLPK